MIALMIGGARHAGLALGLGLLFASAAALSQPAGPGRGPGSGPGSGEDDPAVMSDTAAWCVQFAAQVEAVRRGVAEPHPQADMLVREGRRLCRSGHVRLGVMRLRYALIELRER